MLVAITIATTMIIEFEEKKNFSSIDYSVIPKRSVITPKSWYEMIQAYCSNGYRNEDEGVDLKNILKKAIDKTYFSSWN